MSQDSANESTVITFPTVRHDPEHPSVSVRLRVVSDGTWQGTKVLANGKPVHNVTRVEWMCPTPNSHARVYLELTGIPVELEGDHDEPARLSAEQTQRP